MASKPEVIKMFLLCERLTAVVPREPVKFNVFGPTLIFSSPQKKEQKGSGAVCYERIG